MSTPPISVSVTMVPGWDLGTSIERLTALGLDGIGVTRAAVEAAGRPAAIAALQRSGLRVASYQQTELFDVVDPQAVDRGALLEDLDTAAAIGAECVYALAGRRGGLPWADAAGRLAEQIAEVLPLLRERRLRLALEPIHPLRQDLTFVSLLADTVAILDAVGEPDCGYVLDTWHTWWQRDVIEVLTANPSRLLSVQLSDHKPVTLRTLDRAQLGAGIIPWPPLVGALRASGYRGCIDLEIISDDNEQAGYASVIGTARRTIAAWWEENDGLR